MAQCMGNSVFQAIHVYSYMFPTRHMHTHIIRMGVHMPSQATHVYTCFQLGTCTPISWSTVVLHM